MLWLAVHLPLLSLEAWAATLVPDPGRISSGRGVQAIQAARAPQAAVREASTSLGTSLPAAASRAAAPEPPLALLDQHCVCAVNAAAAAAGVLSGQKRATALALAPAIRFGQADARRDAQALHALAYAALAFTPAVLVDGHCVLLEVASCLRYFNGADVLLTRLRRTLAPLGHRMQIAAAPTAAGAALLARWRDDLATGPHRHDLSALQQLLDEAPVWMLGPGREHWEALQGMGLRHLSDLRALPRSGLARRFGQALLDELDRARGERPDPRPWLAAPPRFAARLELAWRADRSDQLLHAAAQLLAQLVAWAQARCSRIVAFTIELQHEKSRGAAPDQAPRAQPAAAPGPAAPSCTPLRIELAEPAAEVKHLQALLRERLARLVLPAPVVELRLHCDELRLQAPPNQELFPTRPNTQTGLLRLIERLSARLGDEQVLRLQTVDDHRPERALRLLPAVSFGPGNRGVAEPGRMVTEAGARLGSTLSTRHEPSWWADPEWSLPHPAWLLREPQPLAENQAMPLLGGRALLLLAGPERIETGWWDDGLVTRDYFIAQDHDGTLLWIYRARLPVADDAEPLWYLQGWFG